MKRIENQWERSVVATQALPRPHFHYSPVVRTGPLVFISGMVALNPLHGRLIEGDAGVQTTQILANLQALMSEQGWFLQQLALTRIYCTDFSAFGLINQAWEAFFAGHEPPARTSLGVSALPLGALVEVEFQFALGPVTAG